MEEKVYMKGYKAFRPGLVCDPDGNRFQYAENTVFEMDSEPVICKSGFHFCKNPLDVLDYYPLINDDGTVNEFAEVEALGDCVTDDDKKYATKKIRVGAKLDFVKLVQAAVEFDYTSTKNKDGEVLSSKKNSAKMASSGNYAKMASSGYSAQMASSGNYAQMASSGYSAQMASSGKNAVVMCAGNHGKAKAKIGSWITLSEWDYVDYEYTPVCVRTEKVDGVRVREDVFYTLKNGEFVEVES